MQRSRRSLFAFRFSLFGHIQRLKYFAFEPNRDSAHCYQRDREGLNF
jgi:hypothetical protein